MNNQPGAAAAQTAGLCARCRHVRPIGNKRGSTFYLCRRSFSEKRFAKYPALPVEECCGFEAATDSGNGPTV